MPLLYSLYQDPSGSNDSKYTADFHDVIDNGSNNPFPWPFGGFGFSSNQATSGYDAITGLGSPHANSLVTALTGAGGTTTNPGGTGGSGGTGGTTTPPTTLPDSPIVGTLLTSLPVTALAGDHGSLRLQLSNTAATRFSGPLVITLYASTDVALSSDDVVIGTLTLSKLKLGAGGEKTVKVKYNLPATLPTGSYTAIASLAATGTSTNPTQTISPSTISVEPATVDLSTAFANVPPITVTPGRKGSATITVENLGNVAAIGSISLSLFASDTAVVDSTATLLRAVITRTIHLKPNHTLTFHVHFTAPLNRQAGSYNVLASIASATTVKDGNSENDVAVIATA